MEIKHDEDQQSYLGMIDGRVAARADYELAEGRIHMTHTEVDPAHRGKGLAAEVVTAALDDVRVRDLRLVPACSYVRWFVEHHEEYQDLM